MNQVKEQVLNNDREIRPFRIAVSRDQLDDLQYRLAHARWPEPAKGSGWKYGVALEHVKEMAEYWQREFDWSKQEARLNAHPHFTATVDGANVHFLHVRSPEPDAFPILLTHGWPSSFVEFLDMIGPLTDPRAHGGDPKDAFHLVIPSIPGFTFSGSEQGEGWSSARTARAWAELMQRLGYTRYGAHGGDAGSLITREMGIQQPAGLEGIHVLQLFSFPSGDPAEMANLTEDDQQRLQVLGNFQERAGFSAIQSTRPLTLSYGLADSPVGQLAWNAELFNNFGDTIDTVDRDTYLTNVMLYWLTNTAESSARFYYEDAHQTEPSTGPNHTPTGIAVFRNDFQSIRRFAERDNTQIVYWSEFDRGGHFAALDATDLLAQDLRDFFRRFR